MVKIDISALGKDDINSFLIGDWERDAVGYEKELCGGSDKFIMSFIRADSTFNADGTLEYYTHSKKTNEICHDEHPSLSFVFYDVIKNDSTLRLDVIGYLWNEKWELDILNRNNITLKQKRYTRSNRVK